MARPKMQQDDTEAVAVGFNPVPADIDPVYGDTRQVVQLTANQIVAYNLAQARMWKNWTQEEAAAELEPYLGVRWSKASFSSAERSVDGQRVRQFSADELVAFSRCFGVPVGFFFLPPPPGVADRPIRLASPENPEVGVRPSELVDVVLGAPGEIGLMSMRVDEFFRHTSPDLLTEAQRAMRSLAEASEEAIVAQSMEKFEFWKTSLTTLVQQLEDWERQARRSALSKEDDDG
jgi:hypothetical protein